MTKASDNPFPSILILEGVEPAAPGAGLQRFYIDSTSHKPMLTPASGVEQQILMDADGKVVTTNRSFAGAADTLVIGDAGKIVSSTGASAAACTIPQVSTVAWPVGTVIVIEQYGAGQVTITAGAGVTLRAPRGAKTAIQYSSVTLRHRATNEWVAEGDVTT